MIGSIYGIVALGLVLVYKGSRVVNFAHGEMGMLGAFVVLTLWSEHHWPFPLAAILGVLASGAAGLTTELVVVRRTHGASKLTVLVATLAVAGILQFIGTEVWGLDPKFIQSPLKGRGLVLGQIVLTPPRLLVLGTAAVLSLLLFAVFRYTGFGLAFRATALDDYAARLVGVNVRRISSITWTGGAMLSGIAAILVAPLVSFHVFFMTLLFLRAVTAALVAGMTNLPGAFAAGLLVGVAESLLVKFTTQSGVVEAALFGLIVAILALRPQGLFRAEY